MNWDDVRYFLALHRYGSLTAAARALGVNHATVSRRVDSFEEEIGGQLFHKLPGGWEITKLGASILDHALEAEDAFMRIDRTAVNADESLEGTVRISTSRLFSMLVVIPAAADMQQTFPQITIEVEEDVRFVSLPRREADIALRFAFLDRSPGAGSLHARKLGNFEWALHGAPEFVEQHGLQPPIAEVGDLPIAGYAETAPGQPGLQFLEARSKPNVVVRASSMYAVLDAVRLGHCAGVVPDALAHQIDTVRLSDTLETSQLWIILHPDVADNRRIRSVYDFIVAWCGEHLTDF